MDFQIRTTEDGRIVISTPSLLERTASWCMKVDKRDKLVAEIRQQWEAMTPGERKRLGDNWLKYLEAELKLREAN